MNVCRPVLWMNLNVIFHWPIWQQISDCRFDLKFQSNPRKRALERPIPQSGMYLL